MTTDDDCPCKKKICPFCNGTGQVPEDRQNDKGWWIKQPMSGEEWSRMSFVVCPHCAGLGRVRPEIQE